MKICVCSDSHGNYFGLQELVEKENPRSIFFLGDGERDWTQVNLPYTTAFAAVSGNCDFMSMEPPYRQVQIGGKKIFLTHGHMYGAKQGLSGLVNQALVRDVDLVLYGHTHNQRMDEREGRIFLCPGSMNSSQEEYAILEITEGKPLHIELKKL